MPTGYTNLIDENPNMTGSKWIKEGLVRAFGITIGLRDHGLGMTEQQIEEYLKQESEVGSRYHKEKLEETRDTLWSFRNNPDSWMVLYEDEVDRIIKRNMENISDSMDKQLRHAKIRGDLWKFIALTQDENTRNVAYFGLDQLKLVEDEHKPYLQEVKPYLEWKVAKLYDLIKDLEYYSDELKKAKEREMKRYEAYKTIQREISHINATEVR